LLKDVYKFYKHSPKRYTNEEEWKLTTSFLKKFKILETQFHDLLPINTVKDQFEDFLMEKYDFIKNMNESIFMQYVINMKSEVYDHFMR
jgi:hypothetical protein